MAGWKDHLKRAIDLAGSQTRLGKQIGCSRSKISWLVCRAAMIDAGDAVAIEAATGGAVAKSDLRPDLWPPRAEHPAAPVAPG
jgi:DNA-binding transcriptional regulator YdaS (Cro superfamily)